MKVLGIRFCSVSEEAEELASFLKDGLGLPVKEGVTAPSYEKKSGGFHGCVFPAGESWIEVWPENSGMSGGTMLQILVDDADAWAERARSNGLEPQGPLDAENERIYCLQAPTGLLITFLSKHSVN